MGGGWGGRAYEDGENATVSMCQGDVQNAPVEMQEIYYPVLVEHHRLREGSGGAGKFRGGLGIEIACACSRSAYQHQYRAPNAAWGFLAASAAPPSAGETVAGGSWRLAYQKPNYPLKKRQRYVLYAGGGGYGPP
jgi:N-methylhydantoinase B